LAIDINGVVVLDSLAASVVVVLVRGREGSMPVTSDFVRELFTAANQIEVVSTSESSIERAASTIKDQRERLAALGNILPLTQDITADLPKLLRHFDVTPPQFIAVTLIKCADEIVRLGRLLGTSEGR
jgi:hypothetical protein